MGDHPHRWVQRIRWGQEKAVRLANQYLLLRKQFVQPEVIGGAEFVVGLQNPNQFGQLKCFLLLVMKAEERDRLRRGSNAVETKGKFLSNQGVLFLR